MVIVAPVLPAEDWALVTPVPIPAMPITATMAHNEAAMILFFIHIKEVLKKLCLYPTHRFY